MSCSKCKYNRGSDGKWVACTSGAHAKFMDECGWVNRHQKVLGLKGSFPVVSADYLHTSCQHFIDKYTGQMAQTLY